MRGYRRLKQSGRLDKIAVVKQALTVHALDLSRRSFSSMVMGCGAASGEIIVRQYLLVRLGGINLNRALLLASADEFGSVVFPLPREWRDLLERHGFKVAHSRSALLWQLYVAALLCYGMLKIGMTVFARAIPRKCAGAESRRYVYFTDLGPGNLPKIRDGLQSHDVISWCLQWTGRVQSIESVRHNVADSSPISVGGVQVLSQSGPLHPIAGWERGRYVFWALGAFAISVIDCLRGRWWHAFILSQSALSAQARILPADALAREYLFHNSGWIYRPLWTYDAEQRGATVSLYFYSTNCEGFKKSDGYPPVSYGYCCMSWPRYLVWDEYQADFVRRAAGSEANINVAGIIWFQSSAVEMPVFDKPGVGVFDVTPHRASRYCTLGLDSEFYTPAIANPFLEHISDAINRHGLLMLWKRKRNIGRVAHPHYRYLADQLAEHSHMVLVEPDISAIRVIESCVAVVSMPFTSTALIAREMGKPSAYYDPSGSLQRDDRAAHGIPILSGTAELDAWLSAQISVQ